MNAIAGVLGVLLLLLTQGETALSGKPEFKIVFVADAAHAQNTNWLNAVKQRWGATGVCLRIVWGDVEEQPDVFNWTGIDAGVSEILSRELDVYIRVSMGVKKPAWVVSGNRGLTDQSFQVRHNGIIFTDSSYIDHPERIHPLNFCDSLSRFYLFRFYSEVMEHLKRKYPASIKEIVPSVSTDEEMEFPYDEMCGYSASEIISFRSFLGQAYDSVGALNLRWGTNFSGFAAIDPRNFNWHLASPRAYDAPSGRVDWIRWRTALLKSFVDSCASIAHTSQNTYFKFGLQLGSIYDSQIERRGWYDVTSLLENIDALRVADVIEFAPTFQFAANFAKSLCRYWSRVNGRAYNFSTESNWPCYNGYAPGVLSSLWTSQLNSYYQEGADAHFVVLWDQNGLDLDGLEDPYARWRNTLVARSNAVMPALREPPEAVHLGCEEGFHKGMIAQWIAGDSTCTSCCSRSNPESVISYFYQTITSSPPSHPNSLYYDGTYDIVTNYMLSNTPTYLRLYYTDLHFTQSSEYITDEAYRSLMRNDVMINMGSAAWYPVDGHGEPGFTPGIRNEYDDPRPPMTKRKY